ncbi:MAG: hypothetical protein RLZZ269_291 [Actinomycetota bacterium]
MAIALDPRCVVEIRPIQTDMHAVYVRRRIVVGLVALVLAVAACLGIRSLASRGDGAAPVSAVTPPTVVNGVDVSGAFALSQGVYVVQPGDTMWSIASSLTDGSVRDYVRQLIQLNGSASLDVGQPLVLPAD